MEEILGHPAGRREVSSRCAVTVYGGGLDLNFQLESACLRCWVRLERHRPGLYAIQELAPHRAGGWRLTGDVTWFDEQGRAVTNRLSRRPGIDSRLKDIGQLLAQVRPALPQWLCSALDEAAFEPRTSRGESRSSAKSMGNAMRAARRSAEQRGQIEPHEWPTLDTMTAPRTRSEQLDCLRLADLTSAERREWLEMHSRNSAVSLRHVLIAHPFPQIDKASRGHRRG